MKLPRHDIGSLVRYGIVGGGQTVALYLATLLLLSWGLKAWHATVILFPIGVIVSFLGNRHWSFGDRVRKSGQLSRYALVYGSVYLFAIAFTWLLERFGVPSRLASLITMPPAALGIYLALNLFVFAKEKTP